VVEELQELVGEQQYAQGQQLEERAWVLGCEATGGRRAKPFFWWSVVLADGVWGQEAQLWVPGRRWAVVVGVGVVSVG